MRLTITADRAARLEASLIARLADGVPRCTKDFRDQGVLASQPVLDQVLAGLARRGKLWQGIQVRQSVTGLNRRDPHAPASRSYRVTVYGLPERPGGET